MTQINELFTLDFIQLALGLFTAMAGLTAIAVVITTFFDKVLKKPIDIFKRFFQTQKQIMEALSDLTEKIDIMQRNTDERFKKSEQKQNERIQAELKDKIAESYRRYHSIGKINDMELEAMEGLIKTYENFGGINSFVHSIVQKEMYTWEQEGENK